MKPLSAVLITLDEEHNLPGCLDSISWCDEIIVVDSGSADRTVEIAASYPNCRVLHQPFLGYGPQKRVGVEAASNDWILSLDADEVVDTALQHSIRSWQESGREDAAGYYLLRRLCFMGREFRHGRESADRVLRLFDRRRGNFSRAPVHERVEVDGPTGILPGRLLHHTYRDLDEYFEKLNRYTSMMALEMFEAGRRTSIPSLVLRPAAVFLQYYFLRSNWRNGFPGFVWSLLASIYKSTKYLKLYELQRSSSEQPEAGE